MTGMDPTASPCAGGERLIGALVPAAITRRPHPVPGPLPVLPRLSLPMDTGPDGLILGMARLDRSGRLSARDVLRALAWRPGHRVDLGVVDGVLVIASVSAGQHVVGGRGELRLPHTTRQMCGIAAGQPVVLAASVPQNVLVVYPACVVARLLDEFHARLARAPDGG